MMAMENIKIKKNNSLHYHYLIFRRIYNQNNINLTKITKIRVCDKVWNKNMKSLKIFMVEIKKVFFFIYKF